MKVAELDERKKMIRAILRRFEIKGDRDLLERRMLKGEIWFLFTETFSKGNPSEVLKRLVDNGLLVLTWERGENPAHVSGYDWMRTKKILMQEQMFAKFINQISSKWHIKKGWVCEYFGTGVFPFHPDGGYEGGFRLVVTIFQTGKEMGFREGADEVWLNLFHGCGVLLSDSGGGVIDGSIEHSIRGASKSVFLALDIFPKK